MLDYPGRLSITTGVLKCERERQKRRSQWCDAFKNFMHTIAVLKTEEEVKKKVSLQKLEQARRLILP